MTTTTPRPRAARAVPAVLAALAALAAACGGGGGSSGGAATDGTICVGGEFSTRPDGLPGLEEAYGIDFPESKVRALDEDSLVFTELDAGNCTFGSISATDGRIAALGLTPLEDDQGFFPPYNASVNVRTEVLEQYPQIEDLFAPIAEDLTDETMIELNRRVEVEGEDPEDVAAGWLEEHGIDESVDLSGARLTVGSKEFTEQLVLGHMTRLALEQAGAEVDDEIGLVGSVAVREALTAGEIDLYWEYLGTGWVTYLGNEESNPDSQEQYEALREADAANGVTWLPPAPFNNSYVIATTDEAAEELGISAISDIEGVLADQG